MNTELTETEKQIIKEAGGIGGLERIFMDPSEIKIANQLVKRGLLVKGTADTKQKNRAYFIL